ncbi:MAG TPA: hypothetical protein V6C81_22435 [Planktothrix sp.]|jgi:hypothetical protein
MRLKAGLCLSLTLTLLCGNAGLAQGDTSTADQYPHVTAIEKAVLGTAYPGQPLGTRLSRMEMKAFGAVSKNPDLSARTDALEQYAENTLHQSFPEMNADNWPDTTSGDSEQSSAGSQTQVADSAPQTDYPRIDALEHDILGKTYLGQPLEGRLARLELKAFGKPSDSDDLGTRTDALESYAVNTLHKGVVRDAAFGGGNPEGGSAAATTNADPGGSSGGTDYPRVDALEKAILGQTYLTEPLGERLSRMETTAFGKPSGSDDLGDRTDALQKYADKKLHKKVLPDNATADSAGGGKPESDLDKVASFVGKTLLGMAGAPVGGLGSGAIGGVNPIGLAGGLGGGLIPGFSGIRARPRSAAQQQQQQPVDNHPQDPAVYAKSPPSADARLITKVGWCEVRVFGHTFPDMHLEQRLKQLNDQVRFDPGQTSLQLMDHIGALMKDVEAKTPAPSSVATSPATTH